MWVGSTRLAITRPEVTCLADKTRVRIRVKTLTLIRHSSSLDTYFSTKVACLIAFDALERRIGNGDGIVVVLHAVVNMSERHTRKMGPVSLRLGEYEGGILAFFTTQGLGLEELWVELEAIESGVIRIAVALSIR